MGLLFLLKNGCKPFAHSVVMTSSPVNPTTFPAYMKSVVALPDIGRYPTRHRFPIHLKDNFVAPEAAAERVYVAHPDIQFSHHLHHLLKWVVIPDEYQGTIFKP
jgi:hypothetical protein